MSYKLKSLLYFACFLISVVTYYSMDHEFELDEMANSAELVDVAMENTSSERVIE